MAAPARRPRAAAPLQVFLGNLSNSDPAARGRAAARDLPAMADYAVVAAGLDRVRQSYAASAPGVVALAVASGVPAPRCGSCGSPSAPSTPWRATRDAAAYGLHPRHPPFGQSGASRTSSPSLAPHVGGLGRRVAAQRFLVSLGVLPIAASGVGSDFAVHHRHPLSPRQGGGPWRLAAARAARPGLRSLPVRFTFYSLSVGPRLLGRRLLWGGVPSGAPPPPHEHQDLALL